MPRFLVFLGISRNWKMIVLRYSFGINITMIMCLFSFIYFIASATLPPKLRSKRSEMRRPRLAKFNMFNRAEIDEEIHRNGCWAGFCVLGMTFAINVQIRWFLKLWTHKRRCYDSSINNLSQINLHQEVNFVTIFGSKKWCFYSNNAHPASITEGGIWAIQDTWKFRVALQFSLILSCWIF